MDSALRLSKGYSTQVIYMIVLPVFFFVFCMLYDPFRIQDTYSFGVFSPGVHLLMLSCIVLVWLIMSRTVFHFLYREFSLRWWQYGLWCLGEVVVISAFMALYTSLFRHESNYFSVLALCLIPFAVWLDWSPFVPAVCSNLRELMLWTAAPLAAFAVAPVLSLLKHRRFPPWVIFLGFLPYFLVCPPFLFPFLAVFRAKPSRFKRM